MLKVFSCALALSFGSGFAIAETCPAAPDHSTELTRLISNVQSAANDTAAQLISNEMWDLWADAPNDKAQQILDDGLVRRAAYDFDGALAAFETLIDYCPEYAEGYNQRAFMLFIRKDYTAALADLDRAIALSPKHIAAIAGRALTLIGLERHKDAQTELRRALTLNPWLKERRFLAEIPVPQEQEL